LQRDDLSGMQLSGNKVRKLEFLLADAVAQGADCIITIGGIQSNHCRATAVAAKYLNLDCYLILRTSKVLVDKDPGLIGNLLVERLVGAHIDLVSKEEYAKIGSVALAGVLKERLLKEGRKPYVIPVGGSNSLGTWGYIEAIKEIKEQCGKGNGEAVFDDIVVACGSGGTIAGLSVGCFLSDLGSKVHAYCVCDDPNYFYDYSQGLLDGLQAGVSSRDIVRIQNAKGLGYALSTAEELKFVSDIAVATGVVLDPVYSGKSLFLQHTYPHPLPSVLDRHLSNPHDYCSPDIFFFRFSEIGWSKLSERTSVGNPSFRPTFLYQFESEGGRIEIIAEEFRELGLAIFRQS
ncbi:putative 1-aminocyclopropane-1-carboxylate deaminase-like, partial [Dorcoceras hygrometricum]